jgi:uncharacterized protein YerC
MSNDEYERLLKKHRNRVRKRAQLAFNDAMSAWKGPSRKVSSETGLSQATINRYRRTKEFGPRGPLMTTYLALSGQ